MFVLIVSSVAWIGPNYLVAVASADTVEKPIQVAERRHLGSAPARFDSCAVHRVREDWCHWVVARRVPGLKWIDAEGDLLYDLSALAMPESGLDPDTRVFPLPLWDTDASDP